MNKQAEEKYPPHALLIIFSALIAYFNALSNVFVWDDISLIVKNPYIKGIEKIPDLFVTGYWASTGHSGGLYRPLTMLSFLVEHSLAGLDPFLYHLDNLLLHTGCSLLVYLLVRRLYGGNVAPVAAALLFVTHPVHTEAVAWTSGRAELLSAIFFLAALYTFISPPGRLPWYVLSPALFFLGIMSKEAAVTLPALILVYLLLFERDKRGATLTSALRHILPYLALIAAFIALRIHFLGVEALPRGDEQALVNVTGYFSFLTMLKAFLGYIRLLFIPTDLHAPYLFAPPESFFDIHVLLFAGIIAGLAALSPKLYRTNRTALFFVIWFFVTLLPVSNIIPAGIIMSERALYLPSVSFCVLAGMLFDRLAVSAGNRRRGLVIAVVSLMLIAGLYAVQSLERNAVWRDPATFNDELITVHQRMLTEFPDSPLIYRLLAISYVGAGRYEEAVEAFRKATLLAPGDVGSRLKLAYACEKAGRNTEAISEIRKVLSDESGLDSKIYTTISSILYDLGYYIEAEKYIRKALEMEPNFGNSHQVYGYILYARGEYDEAYRQHKKAVELDPLLADSWFQMGLVLGQEKEFSAAADALRRAAELNPEDAHLHLLLGAAYLESGRKELAASELETALSMRPDYPEAKALLERLR